MNKASFFQRLVAFGIDFIIVIIFIGLVSFLSYKANEAFLMSNLDGSWGAYLAFTALFLGQLINTICTLAYFGLSWAGTGQTLGKKVMKIKVVSISGEKLTREAAILRWVGYMINIAVFCLGFLWVVIGKSKTTWHDKIAASCVIETQSAPVSE